MPFERYLRADDHAINSNDDLSYYYQDNRHAYDDADCHFTHGQYSSFPEIRNGAYHQPHAVQFQISQLMLNGPPILAPGGGAEVLPAGLLGSTSGSSWLINNGFTPFHSALISRQAAPTLVSPDCISATSYHGVSPDGPHGLPNLSPRFPIGLDPAPKPFSHPTPSLKATSCAPDISPSLSPPDSSDTASCIPSDALVPDSGSMSIPPALALPVYSASGFDVLSILSRVVNRPNPTVQLGPVDLSCSFIIVDVRRNDSPIVYASPTFCHLTGYSEQEVLGRNCRFLQSPTGIVARGDPRCYVSQEAVTYMRKLLSSSKECQTTLVNYRKGGQAFINLITVIPLRGGVHNTPQEADDVVYHIGFQVDLTEQPIRILDKLRDGSYHCVENIPWRTSGMVGNSRLPGIGFGLGQLAQAQNMANMGTKGGKHGQVMNVAVSRELRNLIADTAFTDAVSISTGTNVSGANSALSGPEQGSNVTTPLTMFVSPPSNSTSMNRMSTGGGTMAGSIPPSLSPSLSLLLLEFLPDFLLVLSLKGVFLYVAPSIRLVLGYEPQELVGRSISDICHPADLVPLMRELKEGSVSGLNVQGTGDGNPSAMVIPNLLPKSVDLLFRALPKASSAPGKLNTSSAGQGDVHVHPSQSSSTTAFQLSSGGASCDEIPPYIWLECRGRLHIEPGKGRKAIILSGRARWMPVVRWGSIAGAGSIDDVPRQGINVHSDLRMAADSIDPLEFWALLSLQGTFLVASASVRDVLGWGSSEVIGRSIWAMTKDGDNGMREHVEAELTKLDAPGVCNLVDLPPTVVTTSLVHKELHVVPVRFVFYRTPRPPGHAPPSTSPLGILPTPLIHPLNNPLCPIVCQATVLSDTKYGTNTSNCAGQIQVNEGNVTNESTYPPDASIFEELETTRASSWQYELQQLKFANQRLHEELNALEGTSVGSGPVAGSTSGMAETGSRGTVALGQPGLPSSAVPIPITHQPPFSPQSRLDYTSLMPSTLSAPLSSTRLPNSLHEQDPPSSEWSSLTGANGQSLNPLKRSWRSEDSLTT